MGSTRERLEARIGDLPPGASLTLEASSDPEEARELRLALAEAGWLLRRKDAQGLWQARRDRFRIRPYRPGDERAIPGLFETAFRQRRGIDHWSWLYQEHPWGRHRLTVAEDQEGVDPATGRGALVAHYTGYPVRFYRAGGTLEAHHIGDTMTLPAVRHLGRGPTSLLARTGSHFYDHYCRGRVAFNYGFNAGNIQRFSVRFLEAVRVADVAFWRRPWGSAAEVLEASPATSMGDLRTVNLDADALGEGGRGPLGRALDALFDRVAPAYGFLTHRSAEYLRWRYLERPGAPPYLVGVLDGSRLLAWGAFRRDATRLVWGDALVDPERPEALTLVLADTLAALEADPSATGVKEVSGWFGGAPPGLVQSLEKLGFQRTREPDDLALMCVPFEEPEAPEALKDLFYTLGDSDLF